MARKTAQSFADMPTIHFGDGDGALGVGEEFSGYYMGVKEVQTKEYGLKKVYTFKNELGLCQIWGSANLNQKMTQVNLGVLTFISYVGEQAAKKKGRNPTKLFNVDYDEEDTCQVDAPKVSFRDESDDSDDGQDDDQSDDQDDGQEDDVDQAPPAAKSKPAAQAKPAGKPAGNAGSADAAKAKLAAMLNKNKRPAA